MSFIDFWVLLSATGAAITFNGRASKTHKISTCWCDLGQQHPPAGTKGKSSCCQKETRRIVSNIWSKSSVSRDKGIIGRIKSRVKSIIRSKGGSNIGRRKSRWTFESFEKSKSCGEGNPRCSIGCTLSLKILHTHLAYFNILNLTHIVCALFQLDEFRYSQLLLLGRKRKRPNQSRCI